MYLLLIATCIFRIVTGSINPEYWNEDLNVGKLILRPINSQRLDFDESPIVYNYRFSHEMKLYRTVYGPQWFNQKNVMNWTLNFPTLKNNNNILTNNGVFLLKWASYASWDEAFWRFLFYFKKDQKLKSLLSAGKECYDPWLCSKTNFTNYITCFNGCKKNENIFYPRIVEPSMTDIACIQADGIIYCYGRLTEYKNDSPFYNR